MKPGNTIAERNSTRLMKIVLGGAMGASFGVMVALLGPLIYFQRISSAALKEGQTGTSVLRTVMPTALLIGVIVGGLMGAFLTSIFTKLVKN